MGREVKKKKYRQDIAVNQSVSQSVSQSVRQTFRQTQKLILI